MSEEKPEPKEKKYNVEFTETELIEYVRKLENSEDRQLFIKSQIGVLEQRQYLELLSMLEKEEKEKSK